MNSPFRWIVGLGAGALLLLYVTIISMPESPPTGVDHTAGAAAEACERTVAEQVENARFPFSATATYLGDAEYKLNGTVETVSLGDPVRQNYECYVRYTEAGRYRTDSLTVWQSH